MILQVFAAHCYYAFGEHLKVPIVAMSSAPLFFWGNDMIANPENYAFSQNIFLNFEEPLNFYARVYNTVHTVINKLIFYHLTSEQDEVIKKHFGPNALGVRELERKVALILANSHPSFLGNRPITPALVEVGGLHAYDDDTQQLSPVDNSSYILVIIKKNEDNLLIIFVIFKR